MKRPLKIGDKLVKFFEIPQDVVFAIPHIQLIGNEFIRLENHRGIIEYTSSGMRISTGYGEIKVNGINFIIRKVDQDEIILTGKVRHLELVDWREN